MVFLKEIIVGRVQQKKHFLPMVLGKDIHGAPVVTDLAKKLTYSSLEPLAQVL